MTAYNAASTIKVAVESVLSQSFEDFHLIVLDDGSTDETASIVRATTVAYMFYHGAATT